MSEITNTATIRVVADASGVEAGLRPAVEAARRTEQAVAQVGSGAATSARSVETAQRSIIGSIERTTAAMQAGGRQTAAYYELMARQRGVDPNVLSPYLSALRAVEQAQVRTGTSAAQVANAMRMVPAQLTDVATQLAGGQSPFLVLLQQGGQLRDSFGSIPATIRGVGASLLGLVNPYAVAAAAAGALAIAYNEGSKEADAYNRAIIMSGNAAGTSRNQLADYAGEISKTVGTQAEAAQALAALTATGQVGSENMKQFGLVAVEVQKYIGRSVNDTVKDFAELGKSPLEASLKLSESYHYLTSAVYEQIKALQDQGKNDDAAEVAQKAYAAAFEERANRMKENLGTIERAWMDAKDSAAKAWDVFLGVGRKKTPQQELAEVRAQIALAQQGTAVGGGERNDAAEMTRAKAASKLAALQRRESELQWQVEKDDWDRRQAEISEKLRQAGIEWDKIMDKTLSKEELRQKEIKEARQKGEDAGASDADIAKAVNKINQKYSELNNVTLAQLENARNLEKEKMAGQLADLDAQYKLQLISQDTYYAKKRDMQLREIDLELPIMRKQAEIAGGKEDQSAREKALGDLQVLMERRKNIIKDGANAIQLADAERQKSIDDVVTGWDRTITAQREAVAQELLLFGQSDQARKVYVEQMKIELEMRKNIDERKGKSNAYTAAEIADYRRRTDARKAAVAEVVNEQAAMAAANQLLRDNQRFSADYIADADLRAKRIMQIDAEQWQYLINNTAEGSEARKKLIEQFDVWMANRQMQPVLDRWKGVIENLDNNFQEGFRDMLTNGQNVWSSFAKSIGNTLKTSLADALYQTFLKKYVVQIVASLAGAISGPAVASALTGQSPATGIAGGASSAISIAQAASSLYKAVNGGFEAMGNTVADAIQAGMYQTGMTSQIASNGAFASTVGQTVPYVAAAVASYYASKAVSGGYKIEGIGTLLNYGGILGGVANRVFGMKEKEVTNTGIKGTLSDAGTFAQSFADWSQKGGLLRKNRSGTADTPFSSDMLAALTNGFSQLKAVSSSFASSLGVDVSSIDTYTKTFKIDLGKDGKLEDGITKLMTDVGNELATKLVPNIAQFAKTGESASSTLERLSGDFSATTQTAQLLGKTAEEAFGSAGIASAAARERLVQLAGSTSSLTSMASTYAQNFLTERERLVPVTKAVDAAMSQLGLSWVTTREQFKQVVNSLDLTTEAGAKEFTSLMQLADAFSQVHAASDALSKTEAQIATERSSLQDQYDQLTMTSTQLLDKQRAALDSSNQSLFDQVQAAQKVKTAQDAAKTSLGNFATQMKSFASTAAGLNSSLSLGSLSTLTPEQQYAEARRQFESTRQKAAAGDATAQGNLQSIEQTFLQLSQKINGGDANYSSDLATVMRTNDELVRWATQSVDVAQASLDALNDSSATLTDISATLSKIAQGVQYMPAALADAPGNAKAVAQLDYSVIGASNTIALVDEIKALREEVKGLRAEALKRTGDLIKANEATAQQAADKVVDGVHNAMIDSAWASSNSTRNLS
jgi:phage-related minor tail protein